MKTRLSSIVVVLIILGLAAGCASRKATSPWGDASSGYVLQYHMQEGAADEYSYESNGSQFVDTPMGAMETRSISTATVSYKVAEMTEANVTHDIAYTDLKLEMFTDQGDMNMTPSNIIGKSLLVETTILGRDVELKNADSFPSLEGQTPVEIGLLGFIIEFPEQPVKEGATWTGKTDLEFDKGMTELKMSSDNNYTLLGEEQMMGMDCVKIGMTAKMSMSGSMAMQGQAFDVSGSGDVTGTAYYAYKEGRLVSIESESKLSMNADIPGMGALPISADEKTLIKLKNN